MPHYDYMCDNCEHTLEVFQRITEKPRRKCPECGKLKLRRLIGGGAAIVFKGSGFYQTDYRSESYRKGAEAAKKEKTSTSSSDSKSKKKGKSKAKKSESTSTSSSKT